MPSQSARGRRWVTLAAGVTGVVVAHLVAYAIAFSDAAQRAQVLGATGHGYFMFAAWLAAFSGAIAMACVAAKAARRGSLSHDGDSLVPRFGVLVAWQGFLFVAAEAAERMVSGTALSEMLNGHEVLIGLAVQVAVAAAIVVLLGSAGRLSARLAEAFRRPVVRASRSPRLRTRITQPCYRIVAGSVRSRAPPALTAR